LIKSKDAIETNVADYYVKG